MVKMGAAAGLTNPATSLAQNQGYELPYSTPTSTHLWPSGACEGADPAYSDLQDLQNTGQQDMQEKSQ